MTAPAMSEPEMRVLVAIPHYFRQLASNGSGAHGSLASAPDRRRRTLQQVIQRLHQLFGPQQHLLQIATRRTIPANRDWTTTRLRIVVCSTATDHLLDELEGCDGLFDREVCNVAPELLGFECHRILREGLSDHDLFVYLEDDLVVHDPLLLRKINWFVGHLGDECVLMPNRFELVEQPIVQKIYIDGALADRLVRPFRDARAEPILTSQLMGSRVQFELAGNPHSGAFVLTRQQMQRWSQSPWFLDRDTSWIGPLESAATLGILKTFHIYKPVAGNAAFAEIEHADQRFAARVWDERYHD